MKKLLLIGLLGLFLIPLTALAANFESNQSTTATIASNQTVKNAYLVGNSVSVTGTVTEDLFAAANTISVSGTTGSVNVAGNSITIDGKVNQSVRAAGANITVNNKVGSDLFAAGASISLGQASTINDDLVAGGGTIDLNGIVGGKAYLSGEQITINGQINGDVTIKNSNKITIGKNAVIKGNLNYQAQQVATIDPGAQISGTTTFKQIAGKNYNISRKFKAGLTVFSLGIALATYLLLLVLIYVFPKLMRTAVEKSLAKPWENLGIGFVYLVVVPIAAIILLVTLIGAPIGLLALGLYGTTLGLAKIIVPILAGSLIFKWFSKDKVYRLDWLTALVGSFVVLIVGLIPFLGSLALFVVFLIGLALFARAGIALVRAQR